MYKTKVCKAQHLAEVSHELAQLIHSRKLTGEATNDRADPAEKMRKLARMEAVRQAECSEDTAPVTVSHKTIDMVLCFFPIVSSIYIYFMFFSP